MPRRPGRPGTGVAAPAAVGESSSTVVKSSADGTTTISCDAVSRWFGVLVAVSEVSLQIGPGVTALLGPNGAGKSTLLRMFSGTLAPSRGHVSVLGGDPRTDAAVRARIGLVSQHDALFDHLSAVEMVSVLAALQHLAEPRAAAAAALAQVDLDSDDRRPVSSYSKGMRQRVKVAAALVHQPRVLIADEPLTGLDPVQRRSAIALFRRLGADGVTVLVSSHVLEEVARIGSDIIVIAQGRLAAAGNFHSLRRMLDDRPHRTTVVTDKPRRLAGELIGVPGVLGVTVGDEAGTLAVDVTDPDAFGRAVAPLARRAGATLREVVPTDDDLESVFRYLVDRS
ncbi:MAG TPA: ABC transporter [Acidimicrobiaceae bacterium]|nr:ABC transporter [Acidimicrobiaceae bacterium]